METVKNLSFFYNSRTPSGKCRGSQICSYLNAKANPEKDFENDICIWVKRFPEDNQIVPGKTYIDIVDGEALLGRITKHPEVGVIAHSKLAEKFLKSRLNNKVVLIPHHHCNFERHKRPDINITTVGYIGCKGNLKALPKNLEQDLAKIGLRFKYHIAYKNRKDVSDFFTSIDIQISYRNFEHLIGRSGKINAHANLKNSLRIANGGSFGIPTIAFPEPSYKIDFDGSFAEILKPEEIVSQCERLKNDVNYYNELSRKSMKKAEEFHIENIAPLYLDLKG